MRAIGPLAIGLSLLLAASCGGTTQVTPEGDTGPGDTGSPEVEGDTTPVDAPVDGSPPGAEEACRAYNETLCTAWEKCNPWYFPTYGIDHATCVAHGTRSCLSTFADPGTLASPDALKKCAASITPLGCVQYFRSTGEYATPTTPECGALRKGTLADGASCGSNLQCASGYCETVTGALCGKCAARAVKGASCFVTHPYSCEADTMCVSAKCSPLGEAGAACDASSPCHVDLACVAGKCGPRLKDGDTCDPAQAYQCEWNHWCNRATNQCESHKLVKLGDACGLDAGGSIVDCELGSRCHITNTALYRGKCEAVAKEGAACSFPEQCEYPMVCFGGTCRYRAYGEMCK